MCFWRKLVDTDSRSIWLENPISPCHNRLETPRMCEEMKCGWWMCCVDLCEVCLWFKNPSVDGNNGGRKDVKLPPTNTDKHYSNPSLLKLEVAPATVGLYYSAPYWKKRISSWSRSDQRLEDADDEEDASLKPSHSFSFCVAFIFFPAVWIMWFFFFNSLLFLLIKQSTIYILTRQYLMSTRWVSRSRGC